MLKILIPAHNDGAKEAANVFCSMYHAVTGKNIDTVTDDDGVSDLIVLGTEAELRFTGDKLTDGVIPARFRIRYGTDDYHLFSAQEGTRHYLFLAAGNLRAKFYAVYDYFEQAAGCHYFWDGDVIVHRDEISIEGFDRACSPRFEYRGLRYFAHRSLMRFQAEHWDIDDWKREIDWIMKKRLNLFMLRIGIDDLFQKAFPDLVSYPDYTKPLPEAKERSYDDRTLFWPLQYRGELRKNIMAYGRSRGLWQPEDCGTMSHWYSRTPHEFLEKVKPEFVPQSAGCYSEPTGLVWDFRKDENLDNYMALTEAHVKNYGSGEMFHTIGLAERMCFADRAKNLRMKLYAYRRIIGKLRETYPHAPLLIASWDFFCNWTPEEVRALLNEFDPANTLILDYTSDKKGDYNTFRDWGVIGKFPWTFGIFQAFEASSELRGQYDIIRERFPYAAEDPMCKGLVYWPENSHQDTLMLDYFPSIAWDPKTYKIEEFLPRFCSRRYPAALAPVMEKIWSGMLPVIQLGFWGVWEPNRHIAFREIYPDLYFLLSLSGNNGLISDLDAGLLEGYWRKCNEFLPLQGKTADLIADLAALDFKTMDSFTKRDVIDLARTAFIRAMTFALAKFFHAGESWRETSPCNPFQKIFTEEDLRTLMSLTRRLGGCFTRLLEVSEEYSLNDSLAELKKRHETNPNFEYTLKGNAENCYCRSHIFELAKELYEPGLNMLFAEEERRLAENDRSPWNGLWEKRFQRETKELVDHFYAKPLSEMAPDVKTAFAALPDTLLEMSELIRAL